MYISMLIHTYTYTQTTWVAHAYHSHMSQFPLKTLHSHIFFAHTFYYSRLLDSLTYIMGLRKSCPVTGPLQGGEDSLDPLSCRSFSTKEPLNIGRFCGKWPIKVMDPISFGRPISWFADTHDSLPWISYRLSSNYRMSYLYRSFFAKATYI